MITVIIHSFEYITVNIENLSLNWFIFHNWQCVVKSWNYGDHKLQTMMENDPVSFYWLFIYLLLIICPFFVYAVLTGFHWVAADGYET